MTGLEKEKIFALTSVSILPCRYHQLSPTHYSIKHESGYNHNALKKKSKPMMSYKH